MANLICSIHCYDLNSFESYFAGVLGEIDNEIPVIVTYCIENAKFLKKYNSIIFIKTENKGFDLINKFTVYQFLEYFKINYKFICFLHSKKTD